MTQKVGEQKLCPCCCRFVNSKHGVIQPHNKIFTHGDCVKSRLDKILQTMDVPQKRMNDLHWLDRNLGIRNRNKLDFDLAVWCIGNLLNWNNQNDESDDMPFCYQDDQY